MFEQVKKIVQTPTRLCVGVMSGTSLDGIDIAICRISGTDDLSLSLVYFETIAYTLEEKTALLSLCNVETSRVDLICEWNKRLGKRIGEAVRTVLRHAGIDKSEIAFVSSHGQTVFHMPQKGATLQIGELADIAAVSGILTVGDFRPSDMAYGGEGAPLVPYTDWVLFKSATMSRILINIGGIGNLTALRAGGKLEELVAFDTGPGNVLCDHLIQIHTQGRMSYDPQGSMAAQGRINVALTDRIAQMDSFFEMIPPKSTGRELYTLQFAKELLTIADVMQISFHDVLATVTDYTAYTIADAIARFVPFEADEVYVSGGGLHNLFMMECLSKRLQKRILTVDGLGANGDAKEAAAFALLGDAFLRHTPNNAPRATGAEKPVIMGKLVLAC